MTNKTTILDLHLFGEETSLESSTGETQIPITADAGQNTVAEENENKQPQNEVLNEEELEKEFESLIKGGKYESVFAKRTQAIIDKRFKKFKQIESENEELRNKLTEKEQIKENDFQAEKVKKIIADKKANKLFDKWLSEGKTLEESYPDFNFGNELQNENFALMLKNGVPVKNAYLAIHGEDIIRKKVLQATRNAAESTLKSIRANGFRPAENGTNSQSAIVGKTDVNNLSGKDIRLILKQVENGKKVSF